MHYYKRHLGDYARDTGHLSALEHGVYTLLLDWYYVNERPIPHDKATRIARGNPIETQTVLEEFFVLGPEGWIHNYADREIAKYHAKAAANREAGKLGGRPKKGEKNPEETQTVIERKPKRNPEETLTTNHKPITKNQEKDQKQESSIDDSRASSSDDAPPTRSDPIPYQSIVDLYNGTMIAIPKVRELTPKRRTLIRSAWNASKARQDVRFWTAYFRVCAEDDFLAGRGPYREPHENWRPSFDYLLRADVVTRVFEKAMDSMERAQ